MKQAYELTLTIFLPDHRTDGMMRIRKHNLDRQLFKNKPRDNIKIENELSRNISQRSLSLWVDTLDFYSMSLDLSVSAALLLLPPRKRQVDL